MSSLSPWKRDDSEMLVIVGNGWLLSSSGFIPRTSESEDAATIDYPYIRDTTDPEQNHGMKAEQQEKMQSCIRETQRSCFSLALKGIRKFPQLVAHTAGHRRCCRSVSQLVSVTISTAVSKYLKQQQQINKQTKTNKHHIDRATPWESLTKG